MKRRPASLASVGSTVQRLLAERGPMTEDELAGALDASGLHLGADAMEVLDEVSQSDAMPQVVTLSDGRYVHLPTLLRDRVLTHRVTDVEIRHDVLATELDLDAVTIVASEDEAHRSLTDGSLLASAWSGIDDEPLRDRGIDPAELPDTEHLLLPAGFLAGLGLQPGDLVAISWTDGGWSVTRATDDGHADPARLLDQVRGSFERVREPQYLSELVWDLCASTDAFTTPERPLTELLPMWGLHHQGDLVARDSFDFDRWRLEELASRVASVHRIDEHAGFAVAVLSEHYAALADDLAVLAGTPEAELEDVLDQLLDDDGPDQHPDETAGRSAPGADDGPADPGLTELLRELTESLTDPAAAEALLAETFGHDHHPAALGLFAESLLPVAPDPAQPALHWLLAKAHEHGGHHTEAQAALRDAVGLAPFPPALRDLARYASDRGDAAEAIELLRRAGVDRDDPELAVLTHMATLPARDLGRNRPCWCGSGRKYKVCHLGKEDLPLAERAAWLYQKAGAYTQDGPWRDDILRLALVRSEHWSSPTAVLEALQDGFVLDVVMFEGRVFDAFLDDRGSLLPADERRLAEQWLRVERSLHEVEAVRPGASLTLRDVRSGDVHVVRERTASRTLKPGMLLVARVVPAGDTMQIFGGVEPVALHQRDAVIALLDEGPEPVELVEALSRRFAPPALQNTEGEPLVLHEVELRPSDLDTVTAYLDTAYERVEHDDDGAVWHEQVPGAEQVRAVVRRHGDRLTVSTNSDARLERVMTVLRAADGSLEVLDHDRRTAEDMAELAERFPDLEDEDGVDDDLTSEVPDEAVLEAITGLMRRYEDEWLDQPVPALGGRTPREAADDPTRRDDVVRLLRSWPEPAPGSMDRDRLAALLGLDLA